MIVYKVATHIFIQIFPSILRSQLIVMSNLIVFKHCRACIRVPNKYGDIFDLFLFVWRIMSSILFPLGFLRRFRHFDHTFLSTEKKSTSIFFSTKKLNSFFDKKIWTRFSIKKFNSFFLCWFLISIAYLTMRWQMARENAQYWPDIYSTFDFGGVKKAPTVLWTKIWFLWNRNISWCKSNTK